MFKVVRWIVLFALWAVFLPFEAVFWGLWFLVGCGGGLIILTWQKLSDSMLDWGDWWREGTAQPYIIEHRVSASFPVRELTKKPFKFLLFVMLAEENGDGRLLTCWKNLASYTREQREFNDAIAYLAGAANPAPNQVWNGNYLEAHTPSSPWWKRHATVVWALAATLIAVVGYAQTLRDFVTATFAGPSAEITAVRRAVDVLEGDDFEVEFEIRNTSPYATCAVTFTNVQVEEFKGGQGALATPIEDSKLRLVHRQPLPLSSLKPSAAEKIKLTGKAQTPGYYSIAVTGTASVPLLPLREAPLNHRQEEPLPNADFQPSGEAVLLHVWPKRTVGRRQLIMTGKDKTKSDRCQIKCSFMVGDEFSKGFDIEASLTREPHVSFYELIQFPGNPRAQLRNVSTKGKEITQLIWQAREIAVKTPYEFYVHLVDTERQKRTVDEWERIINNVKFRFSFATSAVAVQ